MVRTILQLAVRFAGAVAVVTYLIAAACSSSDATKPTASPTIVPTSIPTASRTIQATPSPTPLTATFPWQSFDSTADPWVDIPGHFPGYGGHFGNPDDGTLYVHLTDPTIDLDPLKEAILYKFYPSNIDPDTIEITALQGRYDWRDLARWYDLRTHLWSLGITTSDMQESKNRLEFGVLDQQAAVNVTLALQGLGVPLDAFEVHVQPPIVPA